MSATAETDRDRRLAELIDLASSRQRRGEVVDVTLIAEQHPDLAAEFRELWAAHQMADALIRRSATSTGDRQPEPAASPPESYGDFEIIRELGRGGMGVVYLARQKSLDRHVALKMVLHGALASEVDRARFRNEAAAAARLIHPNIVSVHEVGEHDSRPFFCMQYVPGENLAQRLTRGPLPGRDAARLLAGAARGVDHAHSQGVVHRDLKPANVLLAPGDDGALVPLITDFGLAKLLDRSTAGLTVSGAVMGTPSYMAPEQAGASKDIGPSVDIHALGSILYECLTGRPPFQAATPFDTMLLVLEQEPVPPRLLNPSVDRELETICLKCLEKSPRRRYARAADLAADLEAFLGGETISATPSGLGYYLDRIFRETHHAAVLENWGLLWMWHSLVTFLLCLTTQVLAWTGYGSHAVYLALWTVGLVTWGAIFWSLRRRGGTVRFVERQVAHAWAAGVCASIGMFVIEVLMGQKPLTFSPLLAIAAGMVFLFKAGVLSGIFYVAAALMFATALLMAVFPQVGVLLFGLAVAASFFFPGLKYYRQRKRGLHPQAPPAICPR